MNNKHQGGDVHPAGEITGFAVQHPQGHRLAACRLRTAGHQVKPQHVTADHLKNQQQQEGTGYPGAPFIEGECGTNLRFGTAKFFAHRKSTLGRVFYPVC